MFKDVSCQSMEIQTKNIYIFYGGNMFKKWNIKNKNLLDLFH